MRKSTASVRVVLLAVLAMVILFSQTHRQYDAQVRFYGAIAVITIGAGLIGWSGRQILVHWALLPYVGDMISGAGLIVTTIGMGTEVKSGSWLIGIGLAMIFVGNVVQVRNRDRNHDHPREDGWPQAS